VYAFVVKRVKICVFITGRLSSVPWKRKLEDFRSFVIAFLSFLFFDTLVKLDNMEWTIFLL